MGTPQGGAISPLLANVYLHEFDTRISKAGLRLVRYADDFVICCPSEARAHHAAQIARRELLRLHLHLNADKTRVVACRDSLQFLGYEFDRDGAFPLTDSPVPLRLQRTLQAAQQGAHQAGRAAKESGTQLHRDLCERLAELHRTRKETP